MRIGIAGPMSIDMLRPHLQGCKLPRGYSFPMNAMLIGELLQRGHHVTAYTTSPEIGEPLYTSHGRFTLCVAPRPTRHRAKTLFRDEIAGIGQAFRAHPSEVIHAHWTYEFAIAALGSGVPTLVTVHDSATAVLKQFRDAYRLVRWAMNAYTVRRASHLTTVSPYIRASLPAVAQKHAVVVPNLVPNGLIASGAGDGRRERYIVSVSNGFSQLKNLSNALLSFRLLQQTAKDVRYMLVGLDCEPGGPAYRFCEEAGCLDNVVFVGPVTHDRVLDLVRNALFLLHPSYEEACCMAVLEAMAVGTPVVGGAQSGGIPYMIDHGRTGLLCDVADPARIAGAMATLLDDEPLRRQLGAAAQKHVFQHYSASVVVDRYLDAYERVLAGRPLASEVTICSQSAA